MLCVSLIGNKDMALDANVLSGNVTIKDGRMVCKYNIFRTERISSHNRRHFLLNRVNPNNLCRSEPNHLIFSICFLDEREGAGNWNFISPWHTEDKNIWADIIGSV